MHFEALNDALDGLCGRSISLLLMRLGHRSLDEKIFSNQKLALFRAEDDHGDERFVVAV